MVGQFITLRLDVITFMSFISHLCLVLNLWVKISVTSEKL